MRCHGRNSTLLFCSLDLWRLGAMLPMASAFRISRTKSTIVNPHSSLQTSPGLISMLDSSSSTPGDGGLSSSKVREMAAFLSVAMTQTLLAPTKSTSGSSANDGKNKDGIKMTAGKERMETSLAEFLDMDTPINEIKQAESVINSVGKMAPFDREDEVLLGKERGLKNERLPEDFVAEVGRDIETGYSMHEKEGDRVVALKDEFAPDYSIVETNLTPLVDEGADAPAGLVLEPASVSALRSGGIEAGPNADRILVAPRPDKIEGAPKPSDSTSTAATNLEAHRNIAPPIPHFISTAFGRPLVTIREHVPPLRQRLEPPGTAADAARAPRRDALPALLDMVGAAAAGAAVAADEKTPRAGAVVSDEDPYGE